MNVELEKPVKEEVAKNNESTLETVAEPGVEEAPPPEEVENQAAIVGDINNQDCEHHPNKEEVAREDHQREESVVSSSVSSVSTESSVVAEPKTAVYQSEGALLGATSKPLTDIPDNDTIIAPPTKTPNAEVQNDSVESQNITRERANSDEGPDVSDVESTLPP